MRALENVPLTRHAAARMQQRGIRPEALERLLDWGRSARAGAGCELVFLPSSPRRGGAKRRGGAAPAGLYAVLAADGAVLTVGHRTRRIPRP